MREHPAAFRSEILDPLPESWELTAAAIRAWADLAAPTPTHSPVRDRALLLIGFAGAFRRSELGAFGVSAPPSPTVAPDR